MNIEKEKTAIKYLKHFEPNGSGGFAAVQLSGYIETAKTGTVNVGYNKLVTAASGVKTASAGVNRLVIYSDDSTVGFIL